MQEATKLLGAHNTAPNSEDDQGEEDQDKKDVQHGCENTIVAEKGQRAIKSAKDQIEEAELDDNKAPESKEVSDAWDGIAQHASLSQYGQKELTDASIDAVSTVFWTCFYQ